MSVFVFVVNNLNVTRNTKFTVVTLIKLHMSINGPKFKKNDLNGPKLKKNDLPKRNSTQNTSYCQTV